MLFQGLLDILQVMHWSVQQFLLWSVPIELSWSFCFEGYDYFSSHPIVMWHVLLVELGSDICIVCSVIKQTMPHQICVFADLCDETDCGLYKCGCILTDLCHKTDYGLYKCIDDWSMSRNELWPLQMCVLTNLCHEKDYGLYKCV